MSPSDFLDLAVKISFASLALSMFLVVLRIFRGPSLCNRVVALDLLTALIMSAIAVQIIHTGQAVLLHVATLVALTAFLGTIGYAYYVEREKK